LPTSAIDIQDNPTTVQVGHYGRPTVTKTQKVQLLCKRFGGCLEAAKKRPLKGPAGLEKEKGRKPEGKGLVILLMVSVSVSSLWQVSSFSLGDRSHVEGNTMLWHQVCIRLFDCYSVMA
jgi:hypothetical protein